MSLTWIISPASFKSLNIYLYMTRHIIRCCFYLYMGQLVFDHIDLDLEAGASPMKTMESPWSFFPFVELIEIDMQDLSVYRMR